VKHFRRPETHEASRVPPGQKLANGFPVLTYGETPQVSTENWQLKIWGLAVPITIDWSELMAMPQASFSTDFHCVTHWSRLDVQWRGVKVSDLMHQVQLDPKAKFVMLHCEGGYTTNLTLEDFLKAENFFAHTLSDEPLPAAHGGPVRLVVPHLYGWKSAKWINGLEFLAQEALGFWEVNGYHRRGDPWADERYS
jgi:DMSO/TMAO reductase YedYZ molybdopterin-dependent catalytic subunit